MTNGELLYGITHDSDGSVRYEDLEAVLVAPQTHEDCRERICLVSDSSFMSEEKERIVRVL